MSDYRGIAAVTLALQKLLKDKGDSGLILSDITFLSPDKAKESNDGNKKLNLFLYHVTPNAAFRNQSFIPSTSLENQPHPLALTLHYLVTAFGSDENATDPPASHELLGDAMRVLQDNASLSPKYIIQDLPGDSVFDEQIENVRITWNPLTADEMSKLWASFQSAYRLSAAYEVSVVLVRSNKTPAVAPPVLSRRPGTAASWTSLESLTILASGESIDTPLARRPAAEPGSSLLLRGVGLRPDAMVFLRTPDGSESEVPPASVTLQDDGRLLVALPATAAGIHHVFLKMPAENPGDLPELTGSLPFAVVPKITIPFNSVVRGQSLTITLSLPLESTQKLGLFLGSTALSPALQNSSTITATLPEELTFDGQDFPVTKVVRLRIDGVDTMPISVDPVTKTLIFDPDQMVTVTG
jgi:Pvc16 N-terminal domain